MTATEPARAGGFPPPDPQRREWPVIASSTPNTQQSQRRDLFWLATVALLFAVIGVVGALLPAFDGQKVGDSASTAFRVGVPLGFLGGLVAVALGTTCLARFAQSRPPKIVSIVSVSIGGLALLLTMALVFSG